MKKKNEKLEIIPSRLNRRSRSITGTKNRNTACTLKGAFLEGLEAAKHVGKIAVAPGAAAAKKI